MNSEFISRATLLYAPEKPRPESLETLLDYIAKSCLKNQN